MEFSTADALRRWWWLMIVAAIGGGILAYAIVAAQDKEYRATATLLVARQPQDGVIQLDAPDATAQLANTYREIITLRPVLEAAIERGALDTTVGRLKRNVRVGIPPTTALIEVSVIASSPQEAAHAANVLTEAFITYSQEETSLSTTGTVSVVASAEPPAAAEPSGETRTAGAGAVLAALVALALAFLLEARRHSIHSAEEIQEATGLPTLGRIERFSRRASRDRAPQAASRPQSRAVEGYRTARTSLVHTLQIGSEASGLNTLLIASPSSSDGRSTTVANLAVVFGLAGYRVLCLDADLRSPRLHHILGRPNQAGLSQLLTEDAPQLSLAVQDSPYPNVDLLCAGEPPVNPSELLGGSAMYSVLDQARRSYNLVIVDSPPALDVTDAAVVGAAVDFALVVVRAGRTRQGKLQQTIEELRNAGGSVVGVLLNDASGGRRGGPLAEPPPIGGRRPLTRSGESEPRPLAQPRG